MIYTKTPDEIELIRRNCLLVCETLTEVGKVLRPGITGSEIDELAEEYIRDQGALPGFKGYNDFPATLCISRNEVVVHGIPDDEPFADGDIVSIDCGVYFNEFFGDAAYTFAVGEIQPDVMQLCVDTKESLYLAIDQARSGKRIGDIGHAVQQFCEKQKKYGVVRKLSGHGIGKNLHEDPEVPNFGRRGKGTQLKPGMVIAIEPMINMGTKEVLQKTDGWSIITRDRKMSAHYEHSVAITKGEADILSDHEMIETAIKNNNNLSEISVKKSIFALQKN